MKCAKGLFAGMLVCLFATPAPGAQAPETLSLREARQIALSSRPVLRAGQLSVEAARQNTLQAASARYPQLSANVTAADQYRETRTLDGKQTTLDTRIAAGGLNNPTILRRESNGLFLSQLITDFGRTSSLVESARFAETAQKSQADATRALVMLEVADAYYGALEAQSILQVANKTVDARRLLLEKITLMAKNKFKSELDVRFAQINFDEARLLRLRAENAVDAAFARLSTSMGYSDARRYTLVDDPQATMPPEELDRLLERALALRADLAGLRADRESARKLADAARALDYPTINLYAAAGVTPWGDDRLSRNYGAVGINLNLPLLDGGKISAIQEQAQLRALALGESLTEAQNNVLRSVRVAWLNAKSGFENIGIADHLKDAALQALGLADSRYNLGITSIVELNQAQLSAIDAEIAFGRAKYEYLKARAALDFEIGAYEAADAVR